MPVVVVGDDTIQHRLCRGDELNKAFEQRQSNNLEEANLQTIRSSLQQNQMLRQS